MSTTQLLLLPAFVHVALILIVVARVGRERFKAVQSGAVKLSEIRNDNSKWPGPLRQLANNYSNQFEIPVLFYAVLGFVLVTGLADWVEVALAWAFVLSRVVHSLIHTGSNRILRRFQAFLAGVVILAAMWIWFGIRLFVTG